MYVKRKMKLFFPMSKDLPHSQFMPIRQNSLTHPSVFGKISFTSNCKEYKSIVRNINYVHADCPSYNNCRAFRICRK